MPIDSSTPKSCTIGTFEIFTVEEGDDGGDRGGQQRRAHVATASPERVGDA